MSTSIGQVTHSRKLRCSAQLREPGGGGINVARVARRLSADAVAVYPSGGTTGQLLRQMTEAEGIRGPTVSIKDETRENFTILERSSGRQFRFILPGPSVSEEECQRCLATLASVDQRPRFVIASGSLPPGASDDLYVRALHITKDWGAKFILDTSGAALAATLKESFYLIKPNLGEFSEFVGATLVDDDDCIIAARRLIALGHVEIVALTLGHRGALLITHDQAWRASPLPITPISVVGAGDSFLGGMAAGLAAGQDLEGAFRLGVAAGSAAILAPGTGLGQRKDIDRLYPQVAIKPV